MLLHTQISVYQAFKAVNSLTRDQELTKKRGGWESVLGFPKFHSTLTPDDVLQKLAELYEKYGEEALVVIAHSPRFILNAGDRFYHWRRKRTGADTFIYVSTQLDLS